MQNVISMKEIKILKNPILAICKRFAWNEDIIEKGFNSTARFKNATEKKFNAIRLIVIGLIISNLLSWCFLGALTNAYVHHDHNVTEWVK